MPMSYEINLQCCFCGKPIAEKPRVITVDTDGGKEQRLFAHAACFRERLDPSVPVGESGAFGVGLTHHVSRWSVRRVVAILLLWVVVLLVPLAILLFVNRR